MEPRQCWKCKRTDKPLRLDMTSGAFGPICEPICEGCYNLDTLDIKNEFKRFGLGKPPRRHKWDGMPECK